MELSSFYPFGQSPWQSQALHYKNFLGISDFETPDQTAVRVQMPDVVNFTPQKQQLPVNETGVNQ